MRFIDSNVFIHALLKPRRQLSPLELQLKTDAKNILTRVEEGEKVMTTTSHITEVANILEARTSLEQASSTIISIVNTPSIEILPVNVIHVKTAVSTSHRNRIGYNDCLAYVTMNENRVHEIYTFDKDYDRLTGITRYTE